MGKLIVIEAGDGSGKKTQTEKLYNRLTEENYKVKKVEYPNYESQSSALVKMYLNGDFGTDPNDVNPYAASAFYAVDRYASYKTIWKDFYSSGGIILADRYTTSNMIHQAAKIQDKTQRDAYLDWLWEFEFKMFELPVPDAVVFLDMPPEFSRKLMQERNNKFTGDSKKDIHERNQDYLNNTYRAACEIAEKYGWITINCVNDGNIRTIDEIHEDVYRKVVQICAKNE